jgi:hypothetical protein
MEAKMLDDLRDDSEYYEEDDDGNYTYQDSEVGMAPTTDSRFLGMTAPQRFIIALMVLMMVVILGAFFLLITGAIYLPLPG